MYSYKFKDSNVVQDKVKKNRDHVRINIFLMRMLRLWTIIIDKENVLKMPENIATIFCDAHKVNQFVTKVMKFWKTKLKLKLGNG